jgi:hypothetical protein
MPLIFFSLSRILTICISCPHNLKGIEFAVRGKSTFHTPSHPTANNPPSPGLTRLYIFYGIDHDPENADETVTGVTA